MKCWAVSLRDVWSQEDADSRGIKLPLDRTLSCFLAFLIFNICPHVCYQSHDEDSDRAAPWTSSVLEKASLTIHWLKGGLGSSLSLYQPVISDEGETARWICGRLFSISFRVEKALSWLLDSITRSSAFLPLAGEELCLCSQRDREVQGLFIEDKNAG